MSWIKVGQCTHAIFVYIPHGGQAFGHNVIKFFSSCVHNLPPFLNLHGQIQSLEAVSLQLSEYRLRSPGPHKYVRLLLRRKWPVCNLPEYIRPRISARSRHPMNRWLPHRPVTTSAVAFTPVELTSTTGAAHGPEADLVKITLAPSCLAVQPLNEPAAILAATDSGGLFCGCDEQCSPPRRC